MRNTTTTTALAHICLACPQCRIAGGHILCTASAEARGALCVFRTVFPIQEQQKAYLLAQPEQLTMNGGKGRKSGNSERVGGGL